MSHYQSELQRLTALAAQSPRTQEAVRELSRHYSALRDFEGIDDYRKKLRRSPEAIQALCHAIQDSLCMPGSLYLLVLGAGYRLRLAEAIAPDPAALLGLLWEGALRCPKAPYRWVLNRCINARKSVEADDRRASEYTAERAEREGWTLGEAEAGKADPEVDFRLVEILKGALSVLSSSQREALLLRLQGYSSREIAGLLRTTPRQAKNNTGNAKIQLKNNLSLN